MLLQMAEGPGRGRGGCEGDEGWKRGASAEEVSEPGGECATEPNQRR